MPCVGFRLYLLSFLQILNIWNREDYGSGTVLTACVLRHNALCQNSKSAIKPVLPRAFFVQSDQESDLLHQRKGAHWMIN